MQRDPHMHDAYHGDDRYRYGQLDPYSPEAEEEMARFEHDQALARRDRLWEKGDQAGLPIRHFNRHERQDRREAKDERRARAMLRPQTGEVSPAPRSVPLDKAA